MHRSTWNQNHPKSWSKKKQRCWQQNYGIRIKNAYQHSTFSSVSTAKIITKFCYWIVHSIWSNLCRWSSEVDWSKWHYFLHKTISSTLLSFQSFIFISPKFHLITCERSSHVGISAIVPIGPHWQFTNFLPISTLKWSTDYPIHRQ